MGHGIEELSRYRRGLHRIPELDRDLPETTEYLKNALRGLPCEIIPIGDAGFCAYFPVPGRKGAIAFRTDMDALPIEEQNTFDFASVHRGRMHACGHDGHMSIMLGLAGEISEGIAGLPKNALLIFQAAEETTGGAEDICASGIFERYGVERVYGLHLWPGHPKGAIVCRPGEFMAATSVIKAAVTGKSTHAGTYRQGIDALEAAAEFLLRVYGTVAQDADARSLLRFGTFRSGTASNVVAGSAALEGTIRYFSQPVFDRLWSGMEAVAADIGERTGAAFEIVRTKPYLPVINPGWLYESAKTALTEAGFAFEELAEPLFTAEDFSAYQQRCPGLFMHLGTGIDTTLHSGDYDIDESALPTGVEIFMALLRSGI